MPVGHRPLPGHVESIKVLRVRHGTHVEGFSLYGSGWVPLHKLVVREWCKLPSGVQGYDWSILYIQDDLCWPLCSVSTLKIQYLKNGNSYMLTSLILTAKCCEVNTVLAAVLFLSWNVWHGALRRLLRLHLLTLYTACVFEVSNIYWLFDSQWDITNYCYVKTLDIYDCVKARCDSISL